MIKGHSKLPFRLREHPGREDDFFIEAERNDPDEPYDIEVLGEDTSSLYPVAQKRADAELIVVASIAMAKQPIKELIEAIAAHPLYQIVHCNNLNGWQKLPGVRVHDGLQTIEVMFK